MCNLYSLRAPARSILDKVRGKRNLAGNLDVLPSIFPNSKAPLVRVGADGEKELVSGLWGFPPPQIPNSKPKNPYLTNIRRTDSRYWLPWLRKTQHRALIPFSSFAEPDWNQGNRAIWTFFAADDARPLLFFPGIWREYEGDRGTKKEPNVGKHIVYSFLTTDAAPDTGYIHPEASPVILFTERERDTWLNAPIEEALLLQKPAPPGSLKIVAVDTKQDG